MPEEVKRLVEQFRGRVNVSQVSCKTEHDRAVGSSPRGVLVCEGRKESSMWSQIATTQRESYMRSL